MAEIYKHDFQPVSVYGHAVALVAALQPKPGVHLDVGCGYGAIAEPLRDSHTRDYIGLDLAQDGLASLRERGFEVGTIDLADVEGTRSVIREVLKGRHLSSISMLDTLEHLANGPDVIAMLRGEAEATRAPLVLSVPNVAHKDLALKLLVGRWDLTEAGLLDHTHLAFYTARSLAALMRASGWKEVDARDWLLEHSDQEFPRDLQVLRSASPLGHFLRTIVETSNPTFLVNQFVRAYQPAVAEPIALLQDRSDQKRPLLSIIVVPDDGNSASHLLWDTLAGQGADDFEVLSCLSPDDEAPVGLRPRVRVVPSAPEGVQATIDAALVMARGTLVTIVGTADRLDPGYVATFAALARDNPGSVLEVGRTPAVALPVECRTGFAFFDDAVARSGSIAELAIPGTVVRDLGVSFKASLGRWAARDLAARAIELCGVARDPTVTVSGGERVGAEADSEGFLQWLGQLSSKPTLLPVGAAAQIYYAEREAAAQIDLRARAAAALETELVGLRRVLGLQQFRSLIHGLGVRVHNPSPLPAVSEPGPFLTIITRTQGTRERTLRDTLLSLAGQSVTDFEWLLIVHSDDPAVLTSTRAIVDEFPPSLTARVRVLACERPGRAAPLNDGFEHARGDYVCVLDDDDFVFGHYVEIYRDLARSSPDQVLRMACLRQDFAMEQGPAGESRPRATSWFTPTWPGDYDPVAHIHANYTPFMSVAFPVKLVREFDLRFDESLSTTEDWAFTTRAVMLLGIASSPEAGCVYRWWSNAESSSFSHDQAVWIDNRQTIIDRLDRSAILFPPGTAGRVCALIDRKLNLENERSVLIGRHGDLEVVHAASQVHIANLGAMLTANEVQISDLESRLEASASELSRLRAVMTQVGVVANTQFEQIHRSATWRATSIIRHGSREAPTPIEPSAENLTALLDRVRQVQTSTIWEATGPWRSARRILRKLGVHRRRPRHNASPQDDS